MNSFNLLGGTTLPRFLSQSGTLAALLASCQCLCISSSSVG